MPNCEACIAIRVKGRRLVLYPEESNRCASMSPHQCAGEVAATGGYVDDVLAAEGLSRDDVQPILGNSIPCQKHPHLKFGDSFP